METRARWLELGKKLGIDGGFSIDYGRLNMGYSNPERFYHNWSHIEHCLSAFDLVRENLTNPNEVEMAIWYHDVCYNPEAKDNEAASMTLVQGMLRKYPSITQAFRDRVANLIGMTKHDAIPAESDMDARYLLDIDLSALGKPEADYMEDEKKIRREYSMFPDVQFWKGRASFMKRFLARPSIFLTEFFRGRFEEQARKNLEGTIRKGEGKK